MNIEEIARVCGGGAPPIRNGRPPPTRAGRNGPRPSRLCARRRRRVRAFDPLVPEDDGSEFWTALDRDVEHHGRRRSDHDLLASEAHSRSSTGTKVPRSGRTSGGEVDRKACGLHEHLQPGRHAPRRRRGATDAPYGGGCWLPSPTPQSSRTPSSVATAAHLCPPSWLRRSESYDEVRRCVQRVLELPANRLLLTHGGPTDPSAFEA